MKLGVRVEGRNTTRSIRKVDVWLSGKGNSHPHGMWGVGYGYRGKGIETPMACGEWGVTSRSAAACGSSPALTYLPIQGPYEVNKEVLQDTIHFY